MNYYYLRPKNQSHLFIEDKADRDAVIDKILELRKSLDASIPRKQVSGSLVLGTWNIREFGNTKYNGRMPESLYYIAEVISRFDLIAIREVRTDMRELNEVLKLLGDHYAIHISLVTQGASGNHERLAYIYDKRTVDFMNVAGQIVLPKQKGTDAIDQFARSPYVIRFQAGWIKFDIATVHMYYGIDTRTSAQYKRRVKEISTIVDYFEKNYVDEKGKNEADNIFILGDFNIEDTKAPTYKAATSSKFAIPGAILTGKLPGSNQLQTKIYDQILYYSKYDNLRFNKAGVFNYYETVFSNLKDYKGRVKKHYKTALTDKTFVDFRSYQMSDHLPLWVQMETDRSDEYLKFIKGQKV